MYSSIFKKILQNRNDFTNDEINKLEDFIKEEIIIKDNDKYLLNSKYKVGFIKLQNKRAKLKDLFNEYKDINLDFEHLSGAYDGDFVLAKEYLILEVK